MNIDEKINDSYFNLTAAVVEQCFRKLPIAECYTRKMIEEITRNRIKFARSRMLKLFCDCSYNFEFNKISRQIKATANEHFKLWLKRRGIK